VRKGGARSVVEPDPQELPGHRAAAHRHDWHAPVPRIPSHGPPIRYSTTTALRLCGLSGSSPREVARA
jgi:hypothetical protein